MRTQPGLCLAAPQSQIADSPQVCPGGTRPGTLTLPASRTPRLPAPQPLRRPRWHSRPSPRSSWSGGMDFLRVCPPPPLSAPSCAPAWWLRVARGEEPAKLRPEAGAVKSSRMLGRGGRWGEQLWTLVHGQPGDCSVLPCALWDFWVATPG